MTAPHCLWGTSGGTPGPPGRGPRQAREGPPGAHPAGPRPEESAGRAAVPRRAAEPAGRPRGRPPPGPAGQAACLCHRNGCWVPALVGWGFTVKHTGAIRCIVSFAKCHGLSPGKGPSTRFIFSFYVVFFLLLFATDFFTQKFLDDCRKIFLTTRNASGWPQFFPETKNLVNFFDLFPFLGSTKCLIVFM